MITKRAPRSCSLPEKGWLFKNTMLGLVFNLFVFENDWSLIGMVIDHRGSFQCHQPLPLFLFSFLFLNHSLCRSTTHWQADGSVSINLCAGRARPQARHSKISVNGPCCACCHGVAVRILKLKFTASLRTRHFVLTFRTSQSQSFNVQRSTPSHRKA